MATTESASASASGRIAPHRATRTPAGVAPVRSRRREARRAQAAGEPPIASAETPTEPLHHPSELIATPASEQAEDAADLAAARAALATGGPGEKWEDVKASLPAKRSAAKKASKRK